MVMYSTCETSELAFSVEEKDILDDPCLQVVKGCASPRMKLSSHEETEFLFFESYHMKIVDIAMKRNTITVVKRGRHKIPILLTLIKEVGKGISRKCRKKIIVVVPSVDLVNKIQQYEIVKAHCGLDVTELFRTKDIEEITSISFEKEIAANDVIFMTPESFLHALINTFIKLENVSFVIFDECHLATGCHFYAKIMQEFYHTLGTKPKIFGLTASLAFQKGTMGGEDLKSEIQNLMDCQILDTDEGFPCKDEIAHKFYSKPYFDLTNLKDKMKADWNELIVSLSTSSWRDHKDKLNCYRDKLNDVLESFITCLADFGIVCAPEAIEIFLKESFISDEASQNYDHVFNKFREILEYIVHEDVGYRLPDFEVHNVQTVHLGYLSPKVFELIRLLKGLRKSGQMEGLVFVERLHTAKLLETIVLKSRFLSQFSVTYLVEVTEESLETEQKEEPFVAFCNGKVWKLNTTNLIEGICMPNCSWVLLFDVPKTVSCYVQCRRIAIETDSNYIIMLERENSKQRDKFFDILVRSKQLKNDINISDNCADKKALELFSLNVAKIYSSGGSGVSVSLRSSVGRLYQYFETLANDACVKPVPTFEFEIFQNSFRCSVKLPPTTAVLAVTGPWSKSISMAKQLACLEACNKLHYLGVLNNKFLPTTKLADIESSSVEKCGCCGRAGTTKRKELSETTKIQALHGNWKGKNDGYTFNAYKLTPNCSNGDFAEFLFLVDSKLDDDVGEIELDLYTLSKTVKFTSSYVGETTINSKQIYKAKHFHELFFNGLFGSLYSGCKKDQSKEFLLQSESWSLWDTSNMYLLLPLSKPENSTYKIDWETVESASLAVTFLRNRIVLSSKADTMDVEPAKTLSESVDDEGLQFANIKVDGNCSLGMVVMSIHSGRFYIVLKLMDGTSAKSPFIMSVEEKRSRSSLRTYEEYFDQSHNICLKYPEQPLLELKQSHNPHNLLLNFREADADNGRVRKPIQNIHMPPELLYLFNIPAQVLKSFYIFPTIFHRFQSLMLASQLRKDINCQIPNFYIPSSLMLEAITTMRCNENFSLERLELLGDSVLKYGVTCYAYLTNLHQNEGYLTELRKTMICNETLHKLGTSRKLQGYIRDYPFEPLQWQAPGHKVKSQISRQCQCGINTVEVPLQCKYHTENPSIKIGMPCGKGHRWLISKCIADCVEAIIGAYYVSGGIQAALHVMHWFGIDSQIDVSVFKQAISNASLITYVPIEDEISSLESKLGYKFSVKFLLQQAITHGSRQEKEVSYDYQNLEFLGDAVLDLLITRHLYENHSTGDPGELTDLRSASVTNNKYAQLAVKKNLFMHLQYSSSTMENKIAEYVKTLSEIDDTNKHSPLPNAPKALGDFVESIAGAILIDSELNLDRVWEVFKPLLSPIVTPQNLQWPPVRTLTQLCQSLGCSIQEKRSCGDINVELQVQLNDCLIIGEGSGANLKVSKANAASHLLSQFEKKGITYSSIALKRKRKANQVTSPLFEFPNNSKKLKQEPKNTVTISNNNKKGGPRISLNEYCMKMHWPRPSYATEEQKLKSAMEFDDGAKKRIGFVSFVSTVRVNDPQNGALECTGDPRPEKKSSFDSAALKMLALLQQRGHLLVVSDH